MRLRDDAANTSRIGLELVADSFRLFPLPDVDIPEPSEWSDFLRQHPQYVDPRLRGFARLLAEDRNNSEQLAQDYQRLAGTLIRVTLTDEELISIHNGN